MEERGCFDFFRVFVGVTLAVMLVIAAVLVVAKRIEE